MNMHLMDCLPLKTKSEENSSSISSCTQKIGVVWMTINGAISHPTIAFSETRKWSDYPPTKHTDNRSLMQKWEKYSCASAPLSSAERLKVNIWKYEASICVCVFLFPSVSRPVCFQMIKRAHRAAGEPTPTWGPCGEVLDLAQEEQEALSEAWVTTKTSAAQRTPQRERRSSHFEIRLQHLFSLFVLCSWGPCIVGNLK